MTTTKWAILVLALAAISAQSGAKTHSSHRHSTYVVRNGDNDWTVAHRLGVTVKALHAMNPEVRWGALQIGTKLTLPGSTSASSGGTHHRSSDSGSSIRGGGHYTVRQDDNDWTIASKLGVSLKVLHRLNPDTNWNRIHPGEKLVVPGNVASTSSSSRRIRTRYARINADNVILRRGPGTDHDRVTTVDEGTTARVLDHEDGWYKLRFPKGTIAWVRGDLVSAYHETASSGRRSHRYASNSHRRRGHTPEVALAESTVADSSLMEDAYHMRGTRYRYGSSSRGATDCSGFTSQVYARHGVHLPRTAAEQSGVGQRVGRDGLKRGDLVFFHTGRSQRVNHVGIYVGDGKFIHASSGGGKVQVNSLNEGYYSRRFVGARRVAKSAKTAKKK